MSKVEEVDQAMPSSFCLGKPIFFIGFMGAGKTSVARRLARMCRIASVDMDTYIERREGKRISDIFAEQGEAGFRSLESQILEEFSHKDPLLISCGGGIVLSKENRSILKERGFVIYLEVSVDEAAQRISDVSTRPLFKDVETARDVIAQRIPLYEEAADVVIDTTGKSIGRIAAEARDALRKEGLLWPAQK